MPDRTNMIALALLPDPLSAVFHIVCSQIPGNLNQGAIDWPNPVEQPYGHRTCMPYITSRVGTLSSYIQPKRA